MHRNQRMMFMIGTNFIELHVITENARSIRDPSRFDDCPAEIDTCDFDILCICDTGHGDDSALWTTTVGHKIALLQWFNPLRCWNWHWAKPCFGNVSCPFSYFFDTVCALHAPICNVKFQFFFVAYLRTAPNRQCRNDLGLHTRELPLKRVRTWKSQFFAEHLMEVSRWTCLNNWLPNVVGRATAQQPLEHEIADTLETLFVRPLISLPKPVVLEDIWTLQDLQIAICGLHVRKSPDQCGVAALLQHVPQKLLTALLRIYNSASHMSPQKLRAMHATDVQPIANARLLYNLLTY